MTVNIHAHILSYNEEQMIRHTLNYYSEICSRIWLYDNGSTDNTVEIAKTYKKVIIVNFNTGDKFNDQAHREIKNTCWKESAADFVIVCDADEILYSKYLNLTLMHLKQYGYTTPSIQGYNMYSETFPENYSALITDQVKTGMIAKNFNKQIIFDPKQLKEINYSDGAHNFYPIGKVKRNTEPLMLLHYKYLGRERVMKKHETYSSRMSDYNKQLKAGVEYGYGSDFVNKVFDELKNGSSDVI